MNDDHDCDVYGALLEYIVKSLEPRNAIEHTFCKDFADHVWRIVSARKK